MTAFDDAFNSVVKPQNAFDDAFAEVTSEDLSKRQFKTPVWDPEAPIDVAGEGGVLERTMAGIGSGGSSVYRNVANMLGADSAPSLFEGDGEGMLGSLGLGMVDTSDEGLVERKLLDRSISDDTAGSVGQFVGEAAALAPLGVVGKGAQVLSGALKTAGKLPTLAATLGSRFAPVLAEGAAAGAVLANPNERGVGAATGAVTGGILKMATSGMGRLFNRGLVKRSEISKRLSDTIEESTGRKTFTPLRQAMSGTGGGVSDITAGVHNIAGMLPPAKAKLMSQSNQLALDAYEMNVRKAFNPLKGPKIAKAMEETGGDIQMTLEKARRNSAGRQAPYNPEQKIIADLSKKNFMGQYTPSQLHQAAKSSMPKDADLSTAPFYQISKDMKRILEKPNSSSDVATRDVYHTLGNNLNALPSVMPGLGNFIGSPVFQNFLMGNTALQRALQRALETGSAKQFTKIVQHVERAIAAQPAIDDESNDFGNLINQYGSSAKEALQGLGE